jgi:hypothetical protein
MPETTRSGFSCKIAVGCSFDGFTQVGCAVVDGDICTVVFADGQFFIGRRCGDDARAQCFAYLDSGEADTAGSAQYQHGFACLQLRAVHHCVVRRAISQRDGGCGVKIHAGRHRHYGIGRCHYLLRKRAVADEGNDFVTHFDVAHAFADRAHHTR